MQHNCSGGFWHTIFTRDARSLLRFDRAIMKLSALQVTRADPSPAPGKSQDVPLATASRDRSHRYLVYGAAAAVLVVIIGWALRDWAYGRASVTATTVSVATVTRGRFVQDVAAEGSIVAALKPTLFAQAAGTVVYRVRAGDGVKMGQVLAVLDSPDLVSEYQRERDTLEGLDVALRRLRVEDRLQFLAAQHNAARLQLASQAAAQELSRQKAAWDLRVVPERDYKKATYAAQAAALDAANAATAAPLERQNISLEFQAKSIEREREELVVDDLGRQVDRLTVRSPVDGMVGNLEQADHAQVGKDAPLLTVVDLKRLDVEFQVSESDAKGIRPGVVAEVQVDGTESPGRVETISPEVRNYEVNGRIEFLATPSAGLRQGERVSVRLILDDRRDVLMFSRGLGIDGSTKAVYVVRADRATLTPITVGALSTSEVEVLRGLAPGDRVVISDTSGFSGAKEISLSH